MFDINKISRDPVTEQFTCSCNTDSSTIATDIQARYLVPVRKRFGFTTKIEINGSIVIIASNSPDITKRIADQINKGYFMSPLDVFVFYGSSRKGLESRWCVGFDYPDSTHLINFLNTQGRFIVADGNPQNWYDKNGKSYSVVMHTGVIEHQLTEETAKLLNQRVNSCLDAIINTTLRNLNRITVQ